MLSLRTALRTGASHCRYFSTISKQVGEFDASNTSAVFKVFSRTTELGRHLFAHLDTQIEKSDIDQLATKDRIYTNASRQYEARTLVHNTADAFPSAKRYGINTDVNFEKLLDIKEARGEKKFKQELLALMKIKEMKGSKSVISQLTKSGQQEVLLLLKKYIESDDKQKQAEYYRRIQKSISKQKDESELRQKFGLVTELDYEAVSTTPQPKELPESKKSAN